MSYSANQFGGFNEKGQGNGLFFGQASEDGRATSGLTGSAARSFVKQWIYGPSGKVDPKLVQGRARTGQRRRHDPQGGADCGIDGSYATGLDYVPLITTGRTCIQGSGADEQGCTSDGRHPGAVV